ncbi:1705_t:CDS:2, partial [Scutellospora calospora]
GEKWVKGFMRRNNFSNRHHTTVVQKLPEDLEPLKNEFLKNIWSPRTLLFVNPRSLLVMDSFSGHTTDLVKNRFKEKNTNFAIIPSGLTKKLQPLDVYINKSFKDKIGEEIKKLTPTGHIQRPAYNIVADISTTQDSSEEDIIFNYNWVKDPEVRKKSNFIYVNVDNSDNNESIVDLTQDNNSNNNESFVDLTQDDNNDDNHNEINNSDNNNNWDENEENDWNEGWNTDCNDDWNKNQNKDWNEDLNEEWNDSQNESNANKSNYSSYSDAHVYYDEDIDIYYDDKVVEYTNSWDQKLSEP